MADIPEAIFTENKIAICGLAESARHFFGKGGEAQPPWTDNPQSAADATPKGHAPEPAPPGQSRPSPESHFVILCPKCGREIKVPETAVGESGECPYCGHEFAIPRPNGDAPGELVTVAPVEDPRNFAWRRWSARTIDLCIAGLLGAPLWFFVGWCGARMGVGSGILLSLAAPENKALVNSLEWIFELLAEAAIYACFGTTPGKALCGVAVCDDFGRRCGAAAYLWRNARLYVRGLWLGLPLITMFAMVRQYGRVSAGYPATYDYQQRYTAHATRPRRRDDKFLPVVALFVFAVAYVVAKYIPGLLIKLLP